MEKRLCVLDGERVCGDCGECMVCDLDPAKLCDNCMICVQDEPEDGYLKVDIDEIRLDADGTA